MRGFNINWSGDGVNEIGYDADTKRALIYIDARYYRPTEVDMLLGNSEKARRVLGWKPTTTFDELLKMMVDSDCVDCTL
jgi:GDPmannose 4,6-dehydratase